MEANELKNSYLLIIKKTCLNEHGSHACLKFGAKTLICHISLH